MSRTYVLNATIYGARTSNRSLYLNTMRAWSDGNRVGCWKVGSTEYYGAVSFYFDESILSVLRAKTIESIVLAPSCIGTFAYSEDVLYNTKSDPSTSDWTIPNYAYVNRVEKHNAIQPIDMTDIGLPDYGYVIGAYYRTYAYCDIDGGVLTVVTAETLKRITYNGNGGSTISDTILWGEDSWDGNVSSDVPVRTGYRFVGWNTNQNGSGISYDSGDSISIYTDTILYAQWVALKSTIDSVPDTDIGGNVLVSWTNYGQFVNKIRFVFGSQDTSEISVTGASYTFAIPTLWNNELPNSVSGVATVMLYTYLGDTLLGVDSKTFVVSVPASVIPTIGSIVAEKVNENQLVNTWDIYLQEYSKVKLTASNVVAGQGATIVSYKFFGQNLDFSVRTDSASANATSEIIELSGNIVYTVKVTDSRGRVAQLSTTISVVAYSVPVIDVVDAVRSNADGTVNPVTGRSIKVRVNYTWTAVQTNALTTTLSYKKQTDANYTVAQNGVSVNTDYVIAVNVADIASSYNVKLEIEDSLGSFVSFVVLVPPIVGIAFGLNNDRCRFGGPTEEDGFVCDWDMKLEGNLTFRYNGQSVTLTYSDIQALKALIS